MTVMEAIESRKSIRSYSGKAVEEEKLRRVLEAGRLAPSARNAQAWKFVVVRDDALRSRLCEACHGQSSVSEAPLSLVICANDCRDMACGQPARTVDCSIALSFMMLEAAGLGLGTCWLGAFDAEAVRGVLKIPEEYEIVAVTPLGYPAKPGNDRSRLPLKDMVRHDQWLPGIGEGDGNGSE